MQHFANYELVRLIAVGGMGEVYLAHQRTAFGREVTVKIIRPDLMYDVVARKRFQREAEVSSYLNHDHILPMVEFGEEDGRLFIVTPYIKGDTLAQRLEQGSLSLSEVHDIFVSLVEAVAYLHKRGVIHRDLKPGNILLEQDEGREHVKVRLIDFGIAALQGQVEPLTAPLTLTDHTLGTAAFMSPERLNGVVAPCNDIYSLGVILHLMLTSQYPDEQQLQPLPQPLEAVVRRCIAENPADRYSSADELLRAFEQAYKLLTTSHLQATKSPHQESSSARSEASVPGSQPDASLPVVEHGPKSLPPSRPVRSSGIREQTVAPAALEYVNKPVRLEQTSSQRTSGTNSSSKPPKAKPQEARPPMSHEVRLPPLPGKSRLSGDDFNAPTAFLSSEDYEDYKEQRRPAKSTVDDISAPVQKPAIRRKQPPRRRFKSSALLLLTAFIVVLILIIGGITYAIFLFSITANVAVAPRVQPINGVFTLTAKLGAKTSDINSSTLPASVLSSTQRSSKQGQTTGVTDCVLGILDCKPSVSYLDLAILAGQMRPGLKTLIEQDLHKQAISVGAKTIGDIFYRDAGAVADPPVGTSSKTVTVTLMEQGSLEYVKTGDVHDLALQMLRKKLNPNYALIDTMTKIGDPVIQRVNVNGDVTIAVAAAGIGSYQISQIQLTAIQNHIKGMQVKDARAWIIRQPDIDPSLVSVRLSYGNTIPNNTQQIRMTSLAPTNLPPIQLPRISNT